MRPNHVISAPAILLAALGAVALAGGVDAGPQGAPGGQGAAVVINEVQYDPLPAGREARYEWIELLNVGPAPVEVSGWSVADNRATDPLPQFALEAGEYVVVAAGDGFRELFPDYAGDIVVLTGSIGNGLGNSGDQVRLLGPDGALVDGMSYGSDAGALDPPPGAVVAGHSLERVPAGVDSDTAGDWVDQAAPSPGEPGEAPAGATATATGRPGGTPTSTVAASVTPSSTSAATVAPTTTRRPSATPAVPGASSTPSATAVRRPGPGESPVLLNEYLPAPRAVDWNGDGRVDGDDEWVEIYNSADVDFDLSGWQLDDVAEGGSAPYVLPPGSRIPARGYLLLFRTQSRVVLNNDGDEVRLLKPDGSLADVSPYSGTEADQSFARDGDGAGAWTDQLPPTPGATNGPLPTTTATATPPGGRAILPLVLVSEVYYDPEEAGNDADHEWVELHNPGSISVELAGWFLGDGSADDPLPAYALPAGGFVVVAGGAGPSGPGPPGIRLADGRIGNGLANQGDVVTLWSPAGRLVDAVSWGRNREAFDPPVPPVAPGHSIERLPPDVDTDSDADWWPQPEPSPGQAGHRPSPPRVRINEVMPAPSRHDWDGDGTASRDDEWIELHNPGAGPVGLDGWRLGVGDHRWGFTLGPEDSLAPGEYRVFLRRRTDLHLGNAADTVALEGPDGVAVDSFSWTESPGWDRSWSRTGPSPADWTAAWPPSPGRENRPPRRRRRVSRDPGPEGLMGLGELASVPVGSKVRVAGVVVAGLGLLGNDALYLGDRSGGVRVYAPGAAAAGFEASVGDAMEVAGTYLLAFGEPQIRAGPRGLVHAGRGRPLVPGHVATGDLEANLGRLVRISGHVEGWGTSAFTLNDGTGKARVVLRAATGLGRPWLAVGTRITVAGVVGRFSRRGEPGGYRVMPRGDGDFPAGAGGPRLPDTGGGGYSSNSGPSSSAPGYASWGRGMNSGKCCRTCGGVWKVIQSNPPK